MIFFTHVSAVHKEVYMMLNLFIYFFVKKIFCRRKVLIFLTLVSGCLICLCAAVQTFSWVHCTFWFALSCLVSFFNPVYGMNA